MSIVQIEGFETMGPTSATSAEVRARLAERYTTNLGTVPVLLVNDFAGTHKALLIPSSFTSSVHIAFPFPAAMQVNTGGASSAAEAIIFHMRVKLPASLSSNHSLVRFTTGNATTTLLDLVISTNCENISQTRVGSARGTGTAVLNPSAWNVIEWEFKPRTNANGGYGIVRVNGAVAINHTTDDFCFSANDRPSWGIQLASVFASAGTANFEFDDIYIMDRNVTPNNASLGGVRVLPSFPSADTAEKDWTADTGSVNFSRVNNPYDVGYVETDVVANLDRYSLDDAPADAAIHAVKVEARAINATSGSPDLAFGLHNTSTVERTVVVSNTATTDVFSTVVNEKPGGGAWTEAAFNSTEASIRFEA